MIMTTSVALSGVVHPTDSVLTSQPLIYIEPGIVEGVLFQGEGEHLARSLPLMLLQK